jgi:NADP-dependent 3-hydroxy acid dehydrogenase YdfG
VERSGRRYSKIAVVMGATSGFGQAIARLFAAERASLVEGGATIR